MTDTEKALRGLLEECTRELLFERDCLFDCSTDSQGRFSDPDDEQAVRELDDLIDRCRHHLGIEDLQRLRMDPHVH